MPWRPTAARDDGSLRAALGPMRQARAHGAIAVRRKPRPGAAPSLLRHFKCRNLAVEHQAYRFAATCRRRACPGGRRAGTPRQRPGASPTGEETTVSWLAASLAQIRCALPVSVSARVAREWRNSAGPGRLGQEWRIAANLGGPRLAVPRRARARPPGWLPEMREGAAPPGLAVPTRLAYPPRRGWSASAGGVAPPGAESRLRAAPSRPAAQARRGERWP